MDRLRHKRHQPSLSSPSYQFIYYSFDGKTRYTSEVPNHHSKFLMGSSKTFQCSHCRYTTESVLSMMWCPKCKHAAVSVYTRVSFYWDRKKEKRSVRMVTISKMSSVLITNGWMTNIRITICWWEMSIWSDNWKRWQMSNINPDGIIFLKETGGKHWITDCLHVKTWRGRLMRKKFVA